MSVTSSAVEKLKKLEAEAKALRATAKKEALAAVKGAIAALNSLGYSYGLMEHGTAPVPAKKAAKTKGGKITRQRDPNKPCGMCGFVTVPPHDARAHRWQKPQKAFTAAELEEKGMKKKG